MKLTAEIKLNLPEEEDECPARAGRPWSREEDRNLIEELDLAARLIASQHKRTVGAIYARIRVLTLQRFKDSYQ